MDPVVGRNQEIYRLMEILSRRTKNNPCLIGEPGVGKTAIVEAIAWRICEGTVPKTMAGKRIFSLDLSKPIDLNIHAENDIDTILAVLKPYIV